MGNNSSNSSGGGVGFAGLLAIVFIVLKLTKVITWSWIWVLSPLWVVWSLIIVLLIIYKLL